MIQTSNRPGERARLAEKNTLPAGRPPLPPEDRASARLNIRVTERDKEAFEAAAESEGKSLTEWLIEKAKQAAARRATPQKRRNKKTS